MSKLPEKIVRFDVVRVEYGKSKMCTCYGPHYEVDHQNRLVYCADCGAIVDPFEAMERIARATKRWSDYVEELRDQRKQIESYHPRRVVLKELEKLYCSRSREKLVPTCPCCGEAFRLDSLLKTRWCHEAFLDVSKLDTKEE